MAKKEPKHGYGEKICASCKEKMSLCYDKNRDRYYTQTRRDLYNRKICISCYSKLKTHVRREINQELHTMRPEDLWIHLGIEV